MEGLGVDCPEAERWDQSGWQDPKGVPWGLRPTGVPAPEVDVEAQPGAAEGERRERRWQNKPREKEQCHQDREMKWRLPKEECKREEQQRHQHHKRTREFYVVRKDVDKFGQTAGCPGCADASLGISGRHPHNDESRNEVVDG